MEEKALDTRDGDESPWEGRDDSGRLNIVGQPTTHLLKKMAEILIVAKPQMFRSRYLKVTRLEWKLANLWCAEKRTVVMSLLSFSWFTCTHTTGTAYHRSTLLNIFFASNLSVRRRSLHQSDDSGRV